MLSLKQAQTLFDYDPVDGILTRKFNLHGRVNCEAMYIDMISYPTANICWLLYYGIWPDKIVDHKDRDRKNIKINNLRLATHRQNSYNFVRDRPYKYKGVTFDASREKCWRAQIRIEGRKVNLGRFYTCEEAAEAYIFAALEYHGEFMCLE
jgi:hypothetical protein